MGEASASEDEVDEGSPRRPNEGRSSRFIGCIVNDSDHEELRISPRTLLDSVEVQPNTLTGYAPSASSSSLPAIPRAVQATENYSLGGSITQKSRQLQQTKVADCRGKERWNHQRAAWLGVS